MMYPDDSVLIIGTNGRPSLTVFIFVYRGLITVNVYRDEIKRAQTGSHNLCVTLLQFLCLRVFLYLLHADYRNIHSTDKMRTSLGCEDIPAGPHNFTGLFKWG